MNPYLIITGLCCSIIVSGIIPFFASPKVLVENKMPTQDWGNRNSFQLRIKRDEQLRQIEEMKRQMGQKRKTKRKVKRKRKLKETKKKTKNKSKRK